MACDEALLESVESGASGPVLRLYRWRPPAVTLGYGQRGASSIDLNACRRLGVEVVRRLTGGRAVFHDREITYAVVAPVTGCFGGGVLECYRAISTALRNALQILGLKPELVPRRELTRQKPEPFKGSHSPVCFTAPSQFELVIDGRKVAGSAQKRTGKSFLQHGSLPVDMDLNLLARLFPSSPGGEPSAWIEESPVGWLNRGRRKPILLDDLEDAVVKGFESIAPIRWLEEGLYPHEQAAVDRLVNKYRDKGWNQQGRWMTDKRLSEAVLQ